MSLEQKDKKGISLRTVHTCLIIGTVILAGFMFYSTYHLSAEFRDMTAIAEQHIELRKAALELMDASDYLTESVQRFTVRGDTQYMEDYFYEAFEETRREEAIEKMAATSYSSAAVEKLQEAMNGSLKLMDREYYAMRLVIEAKGYTDYPEQLQTVMLSAEDQALSAEDKMRLASQMVLDDTYYTQKDQIRVSMRESLNELEQKAYTTEESALDSLGSELLYVRIVIALQTLGMLFLVWLTSRLGIHPILNAVERIKGEKTIPEVGANEFRYLARTYNKMYKVYTKSIESLNFKASHDELTGAYNRSGYDLILSSLDMDSTCMILLDVDDFKGINDTYGHETGDRVLVKLTQALRNHFHSDDYICRIGGDEFVIFMVHAAGMSEAFIGSKLDAVNKELETTDDGLPPVSISAGVVHGSALSEKDGLLEKTDEAMYRSKRSGKHKYTFYSNDRQQKKTTTKK